MVDRDGHSLAISLALMEEFRVILKEEYDLEPPEEEVKEVATNILQYYRQLERLSNDIS